MIGISERGDYLLELKRRDCLFKELKKRPRDTGIKYKNGYLQLNEPYPYPEEELKGEEKKRTIEINLIPSEGYSKITLKNGL